MAKETRPFIGIDVGGTKIAAALVDGAGQILYGPRREKTRRRRETILAQIEAAVDNALQGGKLTADQITGLGIGVPGVVDSARGVVIHTPNVDLSGLELKAALEKKFGIPTFLGNDVNLGTLGEKWIGAAREVESAVGVFVGTGIGGGIVLNGRIHEGFRGAGAEIGHTIFIAEGPEVPRCNCGNWGCWEAVASRTAIERELRAGMAAGRPSVLPKLVPGPWEKARLTGGPLREAVEAGDELTREVLRRAARLLGLGVASLVNILDPEMVILGGGVIEACGDLMMPIIEAVARENMMPKFPNGRVPDGYPVTQIVRAELGDDAVILGAVALAGAFRPAEPEYPEVQAGEFGKVLVGGQIYDYDVVIRGDGQVKKRKKKLSREVHGQAHTLSAAELAYVCAGGVPQLIIGAGYHAGVTLGKDARRFVDERGIKLELHPSPQAAEVYNRTPGRKALLFHVTC